MTYEYVKGLQIKEGKTKTIFEVKDYPGLVWVENKNDVTANDDEAFTKRFGTKAVCATTTTCKIFELLKQAGIPTAFIEQVSDTEFIMEKTEMVNLEVIVRRLAVGSFTKRRPDLIPKEGQKPSRFHRIITEFFLKTTKGQLEYPNGSKDLGLPQISKADGGTKALDDPLIQNAWESEWNLFMPKLPSWENGADIGISVSPANVLTPSGWVDRPIIQLDTLEDRINYMDELNRKAFLLIEGAWAQLGFTLVDWKIEFGWTKEGMLKISDVIDNDSWRLKGPGFEELSKQLHRDGHALDKIEAKYGYVADMVQRLRIPRQVLVIWAGSKNDLKPDTPKLFGVKVKEVISSGHKSPDNCVKVLERLLLDYPDGGVIIAQAGLSMGLGPVLAARTSWPVLAFSPTAKEHPEDIYTCVRLPSEVPSATFINGDNAVLCALNILAQKNPVAYMYRQFEIEKLDPNC